MTGSGKSVLLRTIALSLLLTHTSNELRMILLDPKGKTFEPFEGAPQLLRSQVTEAPEALEALRSLLHLMEARNRHGESNPCVTVVIDELGELLFSGGNQIAEGLTRLVQRGREVGIHLVAATQRPSSAIMTDLIKVNFPLRLVGKVVSASDARLATGRGGTDAHLLQGRGDFLAIGGGEGDPLRFQAAYVGEQEIASALAKYQREPHAYSPSMSKAEHEARQQKKLPATQPQFQPEPLNVAGAQQLRR
jgi:S-DNA-T family DNA segregation ATPase FtsK/SpoIIIE